MRPEGWFASELKGHHVLMALVGFFGVMLIVNGIFVYFALATFSGGDTSNPYRKGLDYNETLAAAERLAARGWQAEIGYDDQAGRLSVSVRDRAAAPVTGLGLTAVFSRPATDREDRAVGLTEAEPGVYIAEIRLAPGAWVIAVAPSTESDPSTPAYRLKHRLFVAERP
jgi:nitrogen fixation protein FixH